MDAKKAITYAILESQVPPPPPEEAPFHPSEVELSLDYCAQRAVEDGEVPAAGGTRAALLHVARQVLPAASHVELEALESPAALRERILTLLGIRAPDLGS